MLRDLYAAKLRRQPDRGTIVAASGSACAPGGWVGPDARGHKALTPRPPSRRCSSPAARPATPAIVRLLGSGPPVSSLNAPCGYTSNAVLPAFANASKSAKPTLIQAVV